MYPSSVTHMPVYLLCCSMVFMFKIARRFVCNSGANNNGSSSIVIKVVILSAFTYQKYNAGGRACLRNVNRCLYNSNNEEKKKSNNDNEQFFINISTRARSENKGIGFIDYTTNINEGGFLNISPFL